MTRRDQILQQALTLPPGDREFVANLLQGSLPVNQFQTAEIADAWTQEIDWRISAYDRGETTAIDFDVSLDNMRQALEKHRDQKRRSEP